MNNLIETEELTHMADDVLNDERHYIVKCIRKWGNAASDAVLDSTTKIFQSPDIEGVVGYRLEANCIVVLGDPICAPAEMYKLALAFHKHFEAYRIIYLFVSENFGRWALNNVCKIMLEYGEELIVDPLSAPLEGAKGSLARRKSRHAQNEGATVIEYTGCDEVLEKHIENVGDKWLQGRQGPQIYISHVRLFADRMGKRWFYASYKGSVVGVVMLSRLEAKQGWLLNRLMITPQAPHGTSELLVTSVIEALKAQGCHVLTFGVVPLGQLGTIDGFGRSFSWLLRQAFRIAQWIFRLEGKKTFWGKFQPTAERSFLLFGRSRIGLKEIQALTRALNVCIKV